MRKETFAPGEYYHIFSRTISNVPIFKNLANLKRFKLALLMANSTNSTLAFQFLRNNKDISMKDILEIVNDGEKLVDVVCYSIMPDHYHLLLKELKENGISNFVRKCNVSISKYRNIREEKKGPVFESRFNARHVDSNKYLLHLSCYIHLNPLDVLIDRSWRKHGLKNWPVAKNKLLNYFWSSAASFLKKGIENDIIISGTDIILDQFKNQKEYESFLRSWSEDISGKISVYI